MFVLSAAINALLYGSFSWYLLIIFIILAFTAVLIRRALGALMVPICVLFGLEYLANDLGWHGLIMILTSVFLVIYMATKKE